MPELINIEKIKTNLNEYKLNATRNGTKVCCAIIEYSPDVIWLKWIQTEEQYQNKGIGSFVLEYISGISLDRHLNLKINAVNEEVLNFYFKWFSRRADPENINQNAVKEKFSSLLDDDDSLELVLTCEDIAWQASENNLNQVRRF